ncbi:MAG: methionine adenosyltransferase [Armatimonadota bacterium]
MSELSYLFTSESVTEGHPDKVADQISDAVLDAHLDQDKLARVACEVMVTTGRIIVAGEITGKPGVSVDIEKVARQTAAGIGYVSCTGFDALDPANVCFLNLLQPQSGDIGQGVDVGGAGDQGMMFGFACTETQELMPAPIQWAHRLAQRMAAVRKDGTLPYLRPDGKTQVTVEYEGHRAVRVDQVLISSHHDDKITQDELKRDLRAHVVDQVLGPLGMLDADTQYHFNPTGNFLIGGPCADTGLTGRKIIVDTYGGMGRHGGGAFSGKDPTKVDRSASYMMRYVAKNLVAAGVAERLEVQIAYAIGEVDPLGINVNTFDTGNIPERRIVELIRAHFDLTPAGIIRTLDLRRPHFLPTAAYGHFGRTDLDVHWEQVDKAVELAAAAGTEPLALAVA